MQAGKKTRTLTASYEATKYNFIVSELDLAMTFCDIAFNSDNRAKSQRNTENARRAYDAAEHFLQDAHFSRDMKLNVRQKLEKLKVMLEKLDRHSVFAASKTAPAR